MRLCHLLVRQVSKSDNPDNPGSDNSTLNVPVAGSQKINSAGSDNGQSTQSTLNVPVSFIGATSAQKR